MHVLRVEVAGGSLRLVTDGTVVAERQLGPDEVHDLVADVSAVYRQAAPDVRAIGRQLYDWLDRAGDREFSRQLLTNAHGVGMALLVDVEEGLRNLPWELTASRGGLLADNGGPLFSPVRLVGERTAGPERANRPLRLLLMASAPSGSPVALDHERETAGIQVVTKGTGAEVVVEDRGSLGGLRERFLQYEPGWFDVLHLTGHADVHPGLGPVFSLEDDGGKVDRVTPDQLAEAVGGGWPRLVFVSGCRTGESPAPMDPSFAERLIALGASCVVSWSRRVQDRYARLVALKLYERLADGDDVESSVAKARAIVLREEAKRGRADYWHLLRVYSRVGTVGALVTVPETFGRAEPSGRPPAHPIRKEMKRSEWEQRFGVEDLVGRRREIRWALAQLTATRNGSERPAEGLVVHGMGGLGKSKLAVVLSQRLDRYRSLALVGRIDESALHQLVADELGPDAANLVADTDTPLEHRLRRLLRTASTPLLFVFDGFDPNLVPAGAVAGLDARGRGQLLPPAAGVLAALVAAIGAESSPSRMLITCRHPLDLDMTPGRFAHLGLQGLQGDDLVNMTGRLPQLSDRAPDDPVRVGVLEISGGNPGLLRQLDESVQAGGADAGVRALLDRAEAVAEDFRTSIGAGALYDALPPGARTTLAALTACRIPVDRETALAITGGTPTDLCHSAGSSLVEVTFGPEGDDTYRVAPVVAGLAAAALSPELHEAARTRAFARLHAGWTADVGNQSAALAVELVRLGLRADRPEVAPIAADVLAWRMTEHARSGGAIGLSEAVDLAETVLATVDDPLLRLRLGRVQHTRGDLGAAQAHYERALANCPADNAELRAAVFHRLADIAGSQGAVDRAYHLYQQAMAHGEGDGGVACSAVLHRLADIALARGRTDEARDLYRRALDIEEAEDDLFGQAATLLAMGRAALGQCDTVGALDLYQRSLAAAEAAGHVDGKADALLELGKLADGEGDGGRARRLYQQALEIKQAMGDTRGAARVRSAMGNQAFAAGAKRQAAKLYRQALETTIAIGAWPNVANDIGNLAATFDAPTPFYAQAAWLCARVEVPLRPTLTWWTVLARQLPTGHELLPVLGVLATSVEISRTGPDDRAGDRAGDRIMALALGGIDVDDRDAVDRAFFDAIRRAGDPRTVYDRFLVGCEQLVPLNSWLFDRARVPARSPADRQAWDEAIESVVTGRETTSR
jgi:tetratricopeptide (TPR) repeat protein